jgi:sigma-B regulation protein RsbU (phosphoserine phosphatase)
MAVIAVGALGLGVLTGWQAWSSRSSELQEQKTLLPATVNSERLLSELVDQETGQRGYLITQNPSFLQPYAAGQREAGRLVALLRVELAGELRDEGYLREIVQRDRLWLSQIARPEIAEVQSGDRAAAIAAEITGHGKDDFGNLRESVAQLQEDVALQIGQIDDTIDSGTSGIFELVIVRTAVVLLLVVLALLMLRRWINEPIERLTAEVRTVAEGDLDRPIEPTGPPELASLGRDIEGMRRRLRDEADELRQVRETLAERSPLQLLLRSELEATPDTSDFSVAGRLLPAEGVLAGDWYDVWDRPPGGVAVALVDISGHGPAAGLFALKIKHLLSPVIHTEMAPGEALDHVAQECGETDEQFATGIVLELDLPAGVCRYANAGHPPGLLFHEGEVRELSVTGPLLGALPGSWRTDEVSVSQGDVIVLTTDGVTEARRPDGSEFGIDGLIEVVRGHRGDDGPDALAETLISAVRETCAMPLKDDATIVVVQVGPKD